MIKTKKSGHWKLLDYNMVQLSTRVRAAQHLVVQQEAQYFRGKIIRAFNTSGQSNGKRWAPLKPGTIEAKGSSKPLIDRGDLRNSVVAIPAGRNRAFVGVSSKKRSADGTRMVDIAAVHEFGRVIAIQVTQRMFNYVMAQLSERGGKSRKGSGKFKPGATLVIKIPERSFLRATAEAHFTAAKVIPRAQRRFKQILALRGPTSAGRVTLTALKSGGQ